MQNNKEIKSNPKTSEKKRLVRPSTPKPKSKNLFKLNLNKINNPPNTHRNSKINDKFSTISTSNNYHDPNPAVFKDIKNLKFKEFRTIESAHTFLDNVQDLRVVKNNDINNQSSRSHLVLKIRIFKLLDKQIDKTDVQLNDL